MRTIADGTEHGTEREPQEAKGRPPWIEPRYWQVTQTRLEAPGVVTLGLLPPEPFEFLPGQFNMLYQPGIGEVPISISGDPADTGHILHTIRDVGPVTRALCARRPGQRVGVRGPYGTSWPLAAAEGGDLVIVAGGIGLPPLRPALYQALGQRDRFGRVVLLYGARTPDDLLFPDELSAWRARFDLDVYVTVDAAAPGWRGDVGVVPDLVKRAPFDPRNTTAFVVGPEIMMRFTVRALQAAGRLLALGPPVPCQVGTGLVTGLCSGEWVSLHWNSVCDRLTPSRLRALRHYSARHLRLVNAATSGAADPRGTHSTLDARSALPARIPSRR